jgi:hypothetical protein
MKYFLVYAQFVLFVIAILLIAIFWELSKIHSRLKRSLTAESLKFREPGEADDRVAEALDQRGRPRYLSWVIGRLSDNGF